MWWSSWWIRPRSRRTLYLALEALDLGFRVVLAVNLVDEARRAGMTVDDRGARSRPGHAGGTHGGDAGDRRRARSWTPCSRASAAPAPVPPGYGPGLRGAARAAGGRHGGRVCRCLSGSTPAWPLLRSWPKTREAAGEASPRSAYWRSRCVTRCESHFGESGAVHLARERHGAGGDTRRRGRSREHEKTSAYRDAWSLTTWPWTGVPLVVRWLRRSSASCSSSGDLLARWVRGVWEAFASPAITVVITARRGRRHPRQGADCGASMPGIEASLCHRAAVHPDVLLPPRSSGGHGVSQLARVPDRPAHAPPRPARACDRAHGCGGRMQRARAGGGRAVAEQAGAGHRVDDGAVHPV